MQLSRHALMLLNVIGIEIEIEIETAIETAIGSVHATMLHHRDHRGTHHDLAIVLVAISRAMEIVALAVDVLQHNVPRSADQHP
ncbi:hypothetical protein KSZ_10470 [Dictyobacter formicarum]|uniref:PhoU domain-containing protein n=1 Tax=Dictyobacter formicarum TaxID=2778368 RepID=A0ABQ3VCZ9_9CHLR|nr:hypothetical protein KSZ_10470 [Dictyobacter formicarum]